MAEAQVERRLAAILSADVVGYSRMMGEDEPRTLADYSGAAEHSSNLVITVRSIGEGAKLRTSPHGVGFAVEERSARTADSPIAGKRRPVGRQRATRNSHQ